MRPDEVDGFSLQRIRSLPLSPGDPLLQLYLYGWASGGGKRGEGSPLCGVGSPRQASLGGGRFQQLGWKAASHGENAPVRDLGALYSRLEGRGSVQVRDLDPGRTPAAQGGSFWFLDGEEAQHRFAPLRSALLPVAGSRMAGKESQAQPLPRAHAHLRGAFGIVEEKEWGVPKLRGAGPGAESLRQGDGLHPSPAAAHHGTPL